MNKTYAFSDVHGIYDLWAQIKNFCDETDTIYFLGDACDRGEDGITIINELLKDKRVIYLKGNHEDMLTICVPEFIEGHFENLSWWVDNGGTPTWSSLSRFSEDAQLHYVRKLNNLPKTAWYASPKGHKIFLSHAGTDLNYTEEQLIQMGRGHKDPYIWDRKHFCSKHPENLKNVYQVHGHTPVLSTSFPYPLWSDEKTNKVIKYDSGHKFNIDMATFATKEIALIDLDTFETIYFKER